MKYSYDMRRFNRKSLKEATETGEQVAGCG